MSDSTASLSESDIKRVLSLIEALERSSFESLEVEIDGLKLTLGSGKPAAFSQAAPVIGQIARAAPSPVTAQVDQKVGPPPAANTAAPKSVSTAGSRSGSKEVRAPLRGIFYGRPDPASPSFVSIGDKVTAIATVGLVEVMKVFNAVPAGQSGTVAEICVEDGQAVEAGQVLLWITPDGPAAA